MHQGLTMASTMATAYPGLSKLVQVEGAAEAGAPMQIPFELQKVLELSPYSMCAADIRHPAQPLVYVNDRFLEQTKYSRSEILGFNCRFLQGDGTTHATVVSMAKCIQQGKNFLGRLLNYTKTGEKLWNYLLMQPLFDQDGVCTHFTALQIFVPIDNRKMITETAREMAMVAEYVEAKVEPMPRVEEESASFEATLGDNIKKQPAATSRSSIDSAHMPNQRRASILGSDTRAELDKVMEAFQQMSVVVNTKKEQGDKFPIVYVSPALLEATWMGEDEILGSNLTLLLGRAEDSESIAANGKVIQALHTGDDYHDDRWLRTRHSLLDMLYCHMTIKALSNKDGTTNYSVVTFYKVEDRLMPLLVAEPEEHMMAALQKWVLTYRASDVGHTRPSLDLPRPMDEPVAPTANAAQSSLFGGPPPLAVAPEAMASAELSPGVVPLAPPTTAAAQAMIASSSLFDTSTGTTSASATSKGKAKMVSVPKAAAAVAPDAEEDDEERVELSDSDSDADETPQPEPMAMRAPRLSFVRKRREAQSFTLLPVRTQWIDLVIEYMETPGAHRWGLNMAMVEAMRVNLGKFGKELMAEEEE